MYMIRRPYCKHFEVQFTVYATTTNTGKATSSTRSRVSRRIKQAYIAMIVMALCLK